MFARQTRFHLSGALTGNVVYLLEADTALLIEHQGALIIEHPWPAPGTKYVGNGKEREPRPRNLCVTRMS